MTHKEPTITINGHTLSDGESLTIRVAIETFAQYLLNSNPLGGRMDQLYMDNIESIRRMIVNGK